MDTKYKIIIVVFILIALLYAGHFIINSMNSNKKKEGFTLFDDDVEHYEEPPKTTIKKSSTTTSEETKYDLRVLILDDIEKLQITDKDLKGKLMEIMFNEDTLKKTSTMSDNQRYDFIKTNYASLTSTNPIEKSSFTEDTKSKEPPQKTDTPTTSSANTSAISQELIHMTADTMTKLQTAQTNLQAVQNSLTDVQKYAAKIDASGSKVDLVSKSGFQMPKIPEPFVIEGFENIKGFAPAF